MQLPPEELYARTESSVNEVLEKQFARQTALVIAWTRRSM